VACQAKWNPHSTLFHIVLWDSGDEPDIVET
jgi:hypothetical protein